MRLRFEPAPTRTKTPIWSVHTEGSFTLGRVLWRSQWRQFVYLPYEETILAADCLREIADFCETQTSQRRAAWRR
jgi:hypothetical protein